MIKFLIQHSGSIFSAVLTMKDIISVGKTIPTTIGEASHPAGKSTKISKNRNKQA